MTPLVVIRPEPGCSATVEAAASAGLEAHGFPMFTFEPRDWTPPGAGETDALIIGSAAAIRHGGEAIAAVRHLPVHAVGEITAQIARAAGFSVASAGCGGLQRLLNTIPPGTRLLRLAGEERVPLTLPTGVTMIERVVYDSKTLPMADALVRLMTTQAIVMLHSAAAARHFTAELERNDIAQAAIHLAALGPRIAEAAGLGWASVRSAESPNDAALLALAAQLCQTTSEI